MSKKHKKNQQKIQEAEKTPEQPPSQYQYLEGPAYYVILAILVLISYINAFNNDFVSDDTYGIMNNPAISTFANVQNTALRYLQPFLYFVIANTFGIVPFWYRLLNVLAHFGTVSMIFTIFSIISTPLVAFFAAALFAVHPMNIEAVTWISGGPYSWYTFFFLLSFWLYIKAFQNEKRKWLYYVLSVILFVQSLSVGIPAVVLSGVLFVYEYLFGDLKKRWTFLIPYFSFAAIFAFIAVSGIGAREYAFKVDHYQDTVSYNPLLQWPVAISSYLEMFVWPAGLTLYHSEMNFTTGIFAFKVIVLVLYCIALLISFFKSRPIFFGLSLFIIGLLPTLTPQSIHWVVAERYAYFSMIGITFVTAYLLAKIPKKYEGLMFLTMIILIMGFTIRTIVRNSDWKNEDNLWIATGKTSPSDPKTHNNLGDVYTRHGDYARAADELILAIKLNPNYADAYHNLGNVYQRAGQPAAALNMYNQAIRINPRLWQAYQNIGALYFSTQSYGSAEAYMKHAQELNPNSSQLHAFMGVILMNEGNKEAARAEFTMALQLDPKSELALAGMAQLNK
ncbi:tetratricopeptide repeat protein [soil metagenome]